jgi:hypothetical protein
VQGYWIVDLDARVVERWSPTCETPLILRDSAEWMVADAEAPVVIDLPAFFTRIADKLRVVGR